MNKEKTGLLIKNARTEKGLTQLELSDILGVSNKAVSRWECGETFPDVGLLDHLANTLELAIEELVLGERIEPQKDSQPSKEKTYQEIIQAVKLQKKLHARQCMCILGGIFVCTLLGLEGFFCLAGKSTEWPWPVFALSLSILLLISGILASKSEPGKPERKSKILSRISLVTFGYSFILLLAAILIVRNGSLPFSLDFNQFGPFLSYQFKAVWLFNAFTTAFFLWKLSKEASVPVFGLFLSEATAFLAMLYCNVLGTPSSAEVSLIVTLCYTGLVVLLLLIATGITVLYRNQKGYNK